MMRPPSSVQQSTERETTESSLSSSPSRLRTIVLWAAIGAAVYLLARRLSSADVGVSVEDLSEEATRLSEETPRLSEGATRLSESATKLSEGATSLEITDIGESEVEDEAERAEGEESDEGEADVAGEERSDEEIESRAESDIQDEPAEPGEMAVDEEIAEDVTDEESGGEDES